MPTADEIIAALDLQPHLEGGWYRETYRSEAPPGTRAAVTAIYYLLRAGERSHWHRVDATEIWHWYAGDALELRIGAETMRLGGDFAAGERPQAHRAAARMAGGTLPWRLDIGRLHRFAGIRVLGFRIGAAGMGAGTIRRRQRHGSL